MVFKATGRSYQVEFGAELTSLADDPTKIAVAAFMLDVSANATTPMLETVFSQLAEVQEAGSSTTVSSVCRAGENGLLSIAQIPSLDFSEFLSQASAQSFFRYTGSLTTPPCSEGVEWYVASQPIPLSAATYLALKATTKTNNRFSQNVPLQPNVLTIASAPAAGLEEFVVGGNATGTATASASENAVAASQQQTSGSDTLVQASSFNPLVPIGKRRLAKDH